MRPPKPGRLVRIAVLTCGAVIFLVVTWVATIGSAAAQSPPRHEYALRVDFATDSYEEALLRVRNHILAALKAVQAFPPGYPKPCRFRFDSPQRAGTVASVTAYGSEIADTGAYGILLDAEGHYVMLGVVDYPDASPCLLEIFLLGDSEAPVLNQSTRSTFARIVIQFPVLADAQYPSLIEWLAKGVGDAGAHEIAFQ